MYYVYILQLRNGRLYTGSTKNLKKRIERHKNGRAAYTRNKLPVKLIHYEAYSLKSDAQRRESFLKTSKGKKLLKKQIRDLLTIITGL